MSAVKKYIVGNWKMNGAAAMALPLVKSIAGEAAKKPAHAEIVLCPPLTLLHEVATILGGADVRLGAQDVAAQAEGAHTGDVSAAMLKDAGCSYVIVGHSERRAGHGETDMVVRLKAAAALGAGLVPIICIGETLKEREAGKAEEVVKRQISTSLPKVPDGKQILLAYEPVWAIGSGKTPTSADIARMHAFIASQAATATGLAPEAVSVLYGGSVKAANAGEILGTQGVAGALVGGASLKAEEFCPIIASA